jgi:hypothetical protein
VARRQVDDETRFPALDYAGQFADQVFQIGRDFEAPPIVHNRKCALEKRLKVGLHDRAVDLKIGRHGYLL